MTRTSDLLEAGLAAMRSQAERETLERIAADADEAARHALAHYAEGDWLGVDFAEALLGAARALRQAGIKPSPAVVEAMERCTAAHRAWAGAWDRDEVVEAADEGEAVPEAPEPTDESAALGPIRIKVGLGELVKGVLQARRP